MSTSKNMSEQGDMTQVQTQTTIQTSSSKKLVYT